MSTATLVISDDDQSISHVAIFTVEPDNQERLVGLLKHGTETLVSKEPGYIGASVVKSLDGGRVFLYSQWRSAADVDAYRAKPDFIEYVKQVKTLATFESATSRVSWVHRG
jgi:quinol monooxygenase YgiN